LGEQPRVLVVEDEPEIAAELTEILRTRYRVELARDGAEGLAKARALQPDLLVMDVFLPRMDGLDAAVALKSSTDTADIPVILVSAHQGVAEKVRALNLGAVDYLGKPFQAMELLNRTERALKLARTERELQRSVNLLKRSGSDPDTGLLDRTGLESRLEPEVARCRRYGRSLALAVLRPTTFLGEKVRSCAALLRQRVRAPDVVGYLGNGVFALVMPECTGDQARGVLHRLATELERGAGTPFRCQAVDIGESDTPAEALLERLLNQPHPQEGGGQPR
jgi:PleD family two-component response regulator